METADPPLTLSVEYQPTQADLEAFYHNRQFGTAEGQSGLVIGMAGLAVIGALFGMIMAARNASAGGAVVGLIIGLIYPLHLWLSLRVAARIAARQPDFQLPATLVITPEAMFIRQGSSEGRREWSSLREIVGTADHLFLVLGPLQGFVIPRRAFGSPSAAEKYQVVAREHWQAAKDRDAAPLPLAEIEAALGPERLGVEYQLNELDYWKFQRYYLWRNKLTLLPSVAGVLAGGGLIGLLRHSVYLAVVTAAFVAVIFGALTWLVLRRTMEASPNLFKRHSLYISPVALWGRTPGQGDALLEWRAFTEVTANGELILFFSGKIPGVLIPRRSFPSPEEADHFLQRACAWQALHAPPKAPGEKR